MYTLWKGRCERCGVCTSAWRRTGAPDVHFPLLWPLSLTCSGIAGGDGGQMADTETSMSGAGCIHLAGDPGKQLAPQQPWNILQLLEKAKQAQLLSSFSYRTDIRAVLILSSTDEKEKSVFPKTLNCCFNLRVKDVMRRQVIYCWISSLWWIRVTVGIFK